MKFATRRSRWLLREAHIDGFLWPSVVGKTSAASPARSGAIPCRRKFLGEVKARRLPSTDEMETFSLRLNNEVEIASSIFLHRLASCRHSWHELRRSSEKQSRRSSSGRDCGADARERGLANRRSGRHQPTSRVEQKIVLGENLTAVCCCVLE